MSKIDNFGNKRNTNGLDKNPQNIGRANAKKSYKDIIVELKGKGLTPPKKNEYYEITAMLLVMSEEDLKDFASNKERPMWIRWLINDLSDRKIRHKIQSETRDWLFGRATQSTDLTTKGEKILTPVTAGTMTREEMLQYLDGMNDQET